MHSFSAITMLIRMSSFDNLAPPQTQKLSKIQWPQFWIKSNSIKFLEFYLNIQNTIFFSEYITLWYMTTNYIHTLVFFFLMQDINAATSPHSHIKTYKLNIHSKH